jgi:hypothetical protein
MPRVGLREEGSEGWMVLGSWRSLLHKKPCLMEGCATLANAFGYCGKHGGYYRCKQDGCEKAAPRREDCASERVRPISRAKKEED